MTSTSSDRIDGLTTTVAMKAPCRVATTANITLSGTQTIDGVAVVADERVLVKDQTDTTENGIYDVSATGWTRSKDFDGNRDVAKGTLIPVNDGTTNGLTYWRVTTSDPIVIATSSLAFTPHTALVSSVQYLSSYDDLDAAVTAIGATETTLVLDKSDTVSTTIVGPSTLTIQPVNGYKLTVTGSFTHNGAISCDGLIHWLVKSGGTIVLNKAKSFPPHWLGAVADGSTDDATAINNSIVILAASGGGTLFFPPTTNSYLVSSSIVVDYTVNLAGTGYASLITADDCDAISLGSLTAGFGRWTAEKLYINGTNGTTRTAIIHSGTTDDADELYGVKLSELLITNFNQAIDFRTVREFIIDSCWGQHLNSGIILEGKNLVGRINNNTFVKGNGNGTGTSYGFTTLQFNYTGGTGLIKPEGIHIEKNQFFGFDYGIDIQQGVFINVLSNDVSATTQGISWTTVEEKLNIKNNYVIITATTGENALYGRGLASVVATKISVHDNQLQATGTTSCNGLELNSYGANQNQCHISIRGNYFTGFDTYDIFSANAGNINIVDNQCFSANTTSIYVTGTLQGRPVIIDQNYCEGNIKAPFAETQNGQVLVGANTGTFSTLIRGITVISNPSTSATTTYASLLGSGDIPNFDTTANTGFHLCPILMGHSDNAVGNINLTASTTGVTVTLETAPASSVTVYWEVKQMMSYS